jgi:hypothetical protein
MARRYTPELLANLRHRYEDTEEPIPSIAADAGINRIAFHALRARQGWTKRSDSPRDLTPAMALDARAAALEQALAAAAAARAAAGAAPAPGSAQAPAALASFAQERGGAVSPPPASTARGGEGSGVGGSCELANSSPPPGPPFHSGHPPHRADARGEGYGEAVASHAEGPCTGVPAGTFDGAAAEVPLAETIAAMQAEVARHLDGIKRAREAPGALPLNESDRERAARTLATLTTTLERLARMRTGTPPSTGAYADDDVPADIDEFRNELARRIAAFLESRDAAGDAGGDPGSAAVADVR